MLRYLAAFLLSPMPGAFLEALMVAIWPKRGMGIFAHPLSMFAAACLLLYLLELVFGGPALLLLRKTGRHHVGAYMLAGPIAVAGPVLVLLLWTALRGRLTPYAFAYDALWFGAAGYLAGATFWLVARPDRRAHLKSLRTIF